MARQRLAEIRDVRGSLAGIPIVVVSEHVVVVVLIVSLRSRMIMCLSNWLIYALQVGNKADLQRGRRYLTPIVIFFKFYVVYI